MKIRVLYNSNNEEIDRQSFSFDTNYFEKQSAVYDIIPSKAIVYNHQNLS